MKRTNIARIAPAAVACALAGALLGGCAMQAANPEATRGEENRQYMAQVNQIMDDLSVQLESFEDAVSADDLAGMQIEANEAFRTIDELAAIEPTEDMKAVHESYTQGCADLENALSLYLGLYTEIANATEEHPFDYSEYDTRLAEIQEAYDNGIEQLKTGDETVASMQ